MREINLNKYTDYLFMSGKDFEDGNEVDCVLYDNKVFKRVEYDDLPKEILEDLKELKSRKGHEDINVFFWDKEFIYMVDDKELEKWANIPGIAACVVEFEGGIYQKYDGYIYSYIYKRVG